MEPFISPHITISCVFLYFSITSVSCDQLPIETGQWYGIDRENRHCLKCNSRSIHDEFHYIMECQFLTENRIPLRSRNLTQRTNVIKFKQSMCTLEKTKLEKLCRFIRKSTDQILSMLMLNSSCCNVNTVCTCIYVCVYLLMLFVCHVHVCVMLYYSVVTSLYHCNLCFI